MIQPIDTYGRPGQRAKHITPADFFTNASEKTKLNWFLFEYALELELFIRRDKALAARLKRKGVDEKALAMFCVQYSKGMKPQILARVSGKASVIRHDYQPIEALLPNIGDILVDRILTKAAEAWDSQTNDCCLCATRCISERDEKCTLFDDPDHWK